ncbi:MAG: hypothetical protein NVSMB1_00860 [Polyangiales bacterium]
MRDIFDADSDVRSGRAPERAQSDQGDALRAPQVPQHLALHDERNFRETVHGATVYCAELRYWIVIKAPAEVSGIFATVLLTRRSRTDMGDDP